MKTYQYITEGGTITSAIGDFEWRSLCHNEDVMDNWNMFNELNGFGWSVCRRCGKEVSFSKRWTK